MKRELLMFLGQSELEPCSVHGAPRRFAGSGQGSAGGRVTGLCSRSECLPGARDLHSSFLIALLGHC